MDRRFQITARGSTVRREIVGGITTFFAMAYIIFVNPNTLCANVGTQAQPFFPAMPESLWGPVLVATCVSAAIGCFLTGLLANLPFAQAPGMGLNAFLPIRYVWEWAIPGRRDWPLYCSAACSFWPLPFRRCGES